MSENSEIGRVLRASTQGFAFGCRASQLRAPFFGGLVKAEARRDECIYGLIYNFSVEDDPLVRRLVLSENLSTAAIEDQRSNRMLPIEMNVLTVGYREEGKLRHGLPPRPPLNLDPVWMVLEPAELIEFTNRRGYLRLVLRSAQSGVPVDQLLVAHIRSLYALRGNDDLWALGMVEEVIELLRADYVTLVPTLEALGEALPTLPIVSGGAGG